ncbi:MAG: PD-(D/E)XK nuclease family protein [Elusimicrobiota bacterium]|jgi:hypothetical protein|nr:PD-(D/E)XK nuclease family protein [Elusimicrobiota bacterium]
MSALTFYEVAHRYELDGRELPSVTQVLSDMGLTPDFSRVDPDLLKRAQKFGTAVHKATELFDQNNLDFQNLSPEIVPYIEAWESFRRDYGVKIKEIEWRGADGVYKFAGTIDRVAETNNKKALTIIDIKTTTTVSPATALQTAGYALLYKKQANDVFIDRLGVRLLGDGTYKVTLYSGFVSDSYIFLSAVSLWWWRKKHKLMRTKVEV